MASTYVNNLRLNEMATGDGTGTWGTTTNKNLELIADAFGYGTRVIADASTDIITMGDGVSDADRSMYLKLTGGNQACIVSLLPATSSKVWIMENATSYTLTFTCGTGANVAILAGEIKMIATNGGGGSGAVLDVLTDVNLAGTTKVVALTASGAITGSSTIQGTTITATDAFVPDASDGAALGTTSLEFSDLYLADGAVIGFGDDQEVTLTHVHNTGLLLSSTDELEFGDAASRIFQSGDGILRIDGEVTIDMYASGAVLVSNNLQLNSDASMLGFGVNNDVTLTHVHDTGLLLNSTMAIQFNDASQYINAPSNAILDINATDEIELNATAVDLNGTLDVSGTSTLTGAVTASGGITSTAASNTLGATSFNDAAITNVGDIALDSVSSDGSTAPMFYGTGSGGATELANSVDNAGLFVRSVSGSSGGLAIGTNSDSDAYLQAGFAAGSGTKTLHIQPYGGNVTMAGDLAVDGTANLDEVDIDGAVQIDATFTSGVDGQGYDTKFFGDTASAYMLWDTSADDLILGGGAGLVVPDGQFTLASTAVSSTAAELNILDGVTSTTAELNILDGVTSTAAELNILDGVTSTTAELNILDGVTSTTAELNILDGVTSTTAELNILDGVTSTTAELNILDGATVVVGEVNYLDLGATAVGNAIASKAVVLDSNKDYTGIRNLTATTFIGALTGNASGSSASCTGNAATATLAADATTLATPRAINGVNFDGSAAITVTAAAGTLSGGTLNSGVTASSLTSVGTLTSVTTSGDLDVDGTANLDAVDIDGNVNLAGYLDMYNSLYITRADNSAGLQLICTDEDAGSGPLILLDRDTDSPANGDDIGKIYSQGRNDADQLVTYSQISTKAIDVADGTEDGQMLFNIMVNGTSTTVLDLYGPEIEMNTTLVDMNANLDVSGTATLTGAVTASGGITSTAASNTLGATSFNDAAITNVGDIALDSVSSDGSTAPHFLGTGSSGATEIGNAVDNAGLFIRSKTGTGAGMAIGTTSGGDAYLQGCFNDNSGGKTIILNPYGDNVQVTGALSKGSGSFLIPHPLPSMNDTHNLVHSFVEGPRADLIYRGSVALSGGSASVDLDEEVGLTDGTWELLCRDPQVFLQNDTGWAALKGVVSGSTLIITCKDTTSFDTISWLVVAERQDDHMKDPSIDWTDDDGRPILEPLKRQGTVA